MAYDLPHEEPHTRAVTAPDGMTHLITMDGWYWNALEWMDAEENWKKHEFFQLAWKTSKQMENDGTMMHPGDFASEFSAALTMHVWVRAMSFINKGKGIVNDNYGNNF